MTDQKHFAIERVIQTTSTENAVEVAGKDDELGAIEKDTTLFQITPADETEVPFTIRIEVDAKGRFRFVSTDWMGKPAKKPWQQDIQCLSCQTVIR